MLRAAGVPGLLLAAEEAALTSAPGALTPALRQVQVPGKTTGGQRSRTDEIGPGWREQGGPRSGERRSQLKNGTGPGLSLAWSRSPRPSPGSALRVAGSHWRQAQKAVWVSTGDVHCPAICSLPKITAIDMRSIEGCFSYWQILDLKIYFPFPTNYARGFSINTHTKKKCLWMRNTKGLFIVPFRMCLCLCG